MMTCWSGAAERPANPGSNPGGPTTKNVGNKQLGSFWANRREFAGGTILPDGRVALILDIAGLVG